MTSEPVSHTHDLPPFEVAATRLSAFFRQERAPDHIVWVFRDDVTSVRRDIWVRRPLPESANAQAAAAMYEAGRRAGRGVCLNGLCQVGTSMACYVWVPRDDTAAEHALLPRTLKLVLPTPLIVAQEVRSPRRWACLRLINRRRRARPFGDSLARQVPRRPASVRRATCES